MKIFIFLLLFVSATAFAAQKNIEIPPGTHTYGPISVNTLHRFADLTLNRASSDPAMRAHIWIDATTDKGGTWILNVCGLDIQGGPTPSSGLSGCELPLGTTHIRATVTVQNSVLILTNQPGMSSR